MVRGDWQATVHGVGRKELDTTEHVHAHTHTHTHTYTHRHTHTHTPTDGGRDRGGKLLETKRINCLSSLLDLLKHHMTSI